MDYIRTYFDKLNIKITPQVCKNMHLLVTHWETQGTHPLTLNSQLLGVYTFVFTEADRTGLFHVVELEEPDVEAIIKECSKAHSPPPIVLSRKVTSDPFNLLCVYLLYRAHQDLKRERLLCEQFCLNVSKYFYYKMFASLINHFFPHKADEHVMLAVINSFSKKWDIVTLGTWKKVIEERCRIMNSLNSKENIHAKVLEDFAPDKAILYLISDQQTRLRDRVNLIATAYYNYHEEGMRINSQNSTTTDMDGEKILVERNSTVDSAILRVCMDLVSINTWIDNKLVISICKQFTRLSVNQLRTALEALSNRAAIQMKERKFDLEKKKKDHIEYIGLKALFKAILQYTFEFCAKNGINVQSKLKVYLAAQKRFNATYTKEQKVIDTRDSLTKILKDENLGVNSTTLITIRNGVILYIVAKCLKSI